MKRRLRAPAAVLGILALALARVAEAGAVQIQPVAADRDAFDPAKGEQVTVNFRLSAPARADLVVYDARDVRVRRVSSEEALAAGEHALAWDGRDDEGAPLPPEAYHYTIEARADGAAVTYDLTDQTGTDAVIARNAEWDAKAGVIRYLLPERSRVNVRIGIENGGPLLRTLVNWLPREAGIQEEPWDAFDASGAIDLSAHPKLQIVIHAIGFPANTVILGPRMTDRTPYVALADPERRAASPPPGRGRREFAAQKVEELRDVKISLSLPADVPRAPDGVPLVRGPVPVEMDVPDRPERERMLAERIEAAFFVDGVYQYENESGALPTTWTWDPAGATPGDHYLTANLIGVEGHFGTATLRVRFAPK